MLKRDTHVVSNLYRTIKHVNETSIKDVVTKWNDTTEIKLESITAGRSFMVCNHMVEDVYLKYIQMYVLHYRFYADGVLVKCKLIYSDVCPICNSE